MMMMREWCLAFSFGGMRADVEAVWSPGCVTKDTSSYHGMVQYDTIIFRIPYRRSESFWRSLCVRTVNF